MNDRDLENPMVIGDYYEPAQIYAFCDECGNPIYEGDPIHVIRERDSSHRMQFCSECHQRVVAGEKE